MRQPGAQHLGHFNSIDLVAQQPVRNEHFWSKAGCDGVRLVASPGESDLMSAMSETDLQEPPEDYIVFYDQYSRHMLSPYAQDAAAGTDQSCRALFAYISSPVFGPVRIRRPGLDAL